jgi:hypothetical protein
MVEVISRARDDMMCKFLRAPELLDLRLNNDHLFLVTGVQLDTSSEEERFKARVDSLM